MDDQPITLFDRTSRLAGDKAAVMSSARRAAICDLLRRFGPMAIFELAKKMGVHDHQISGRFGEMERDGLIKKTGERRIKPNTACQAEVYAVRDDLPDSRDAGELLGYPATLKIGTEGLFSRGPIIGDQDRPGIPYSLDGGLRLSWRLVLLECDGCGRTLKFLETGKYSCGTPACNSTWYPMLVNEPGQRQVLALVMKHL